MQIKNDVDYTTLDMFRNNELPTSVKFIKGNCETYCYSGFNTIILSHVFEHLYNPRKFIENIKNSRFQIRHDLSQRMKNQLRRIPELKFYLDDSLDYIETIEKDLSNGENPIKISSNDGKK